ncbi:HAD family acid phosphatase [Glutamicibacter sp. PS]|uniref:5'-nucleotidase, lipoprotein e(P4) family n=1 Tax=Glutamicibacter sp. PS TaxID=3075634 RepID=UPI00284327DD|nr:HAD family acid phosphatase [Glutamicibacter sp. PS]MDR4533821.1 hypothetical protein [Glutamicibacter sp. PS]
MKKTIAVAATLAIGGVGGYALVSGEPAAAGAEGHCEVAEYAMGLRWQQQSAEAMALQGQTYALATQQLEKVVQQASKGRSGKLREDLAIITDLDETAIDNSALLARDLENCHDYSTWDTWDHWEREGDPTLIHGALDFFKRADELGVHIYYISDRTEANLDDTLADLQRLGLPQAVEDQVLLLGPPKEERRAAVESEHRVVMQLGDTMHDFDAAYAGSDLETQRELVQQQADKFGREWFVLPNPTYGSWSKATLESWDVEPNEGR